MSETVVAGDKVAFISVPGSYKPGEEVEIHYKLYEGLIINSRDWIGLFKVGWASNRDYYTFEWAPYIAEESGESFEKTRVVKFSGSRLPPDDGNFYQFCYVTQSGVVKGASRPFQFSNYSRGYSDDLEVVEVNEEDSLLLLRTRHESEVSELQKKVKELTLSNVNVEASFVQVKFEADKLKTEQNQYQTRISELEEQIMKLQNEIMQVKINFEKASLKSNERIAAFQSTIEDKQAEINMINTMKEEMKQELDDVTNRVQQLLMTQGHKDDEIRALKEMVSKLTAEKQAVMAEKTETETQLRLQFSSIEERLRKSEEEREKLYGRCEYYQVEVENVNQKAIELQKTLEEVTEETLKEKKENQELKELISLKEQENAVIQQNLCEIAGNVKEPKDQLPPNDDATQYKAALEALQIAYAVIEGDYKKELMTTQAQKRRLGEHEIRIKRCQEAYEVIATENVQLKKRLEKTGPVPSNDSITANVVQLTEELAVKEQELEDFQLKHDERISEKNLIIEQLKEALRATEEKISGLETQEKAMKRSIESLNIENQQMKQQIANIHANPPPPYNPGYYPYGSRPVHQPPPQRHGGRSHHQSSEDRRCPVCNLAYPMRVSQQEFEQHVNSHF